MLKVWHELKMKGNVEFQQSKREVVIPTLRQTLSKLQNNNCFRSVTPTEILILFHFTQNIEMIQLLKSGPTFSPSFVCCLH